jgi:hypothetical protein
MEVSSQLPTLAILLPCRKSHDTHWIGRWVSPHGNSRWFGVEKNLFLVSAVKSQSLSNPQTLLNYKYLHYNNAKFLKDLVTYIY